MNNNILSPFVKTEDSVQFYVNGRVFELNSSSNELKELEQKEVNKSLIPSVQAFENFQFSESKVVWYHEGAKFTYNIQENKFYWGQTEVLLAEEVGQTFSKHVLAAGAVRYENKPLADLFESLPSLVENYIVLDFAAGFEGNNVTVDLFKVDEKVYVSRYNNETKLSKFFVAENGNQAVKYVKDQTGQDALDFLKEMVDGELAKEAEIAGEVKQYESMIAFLKDQRNLLADADKSIEEIKEADTLINQEIKTWEDKIAELKA
jgi:hypothetical protein